MLNILLQILDDGHITDAHGRKVNFENTGIVMTSNAGSNTKVGSVGFNRTADEQGKDRAMKALQDFLRPEFINRVDEIVYFHQLTEDNFKAIAGLMLKELKDSLAERHISLTWEDSLLDHLVKKSYSAAYGARNLRRLIQKELEDAIAERIINSAMRYTDRYRSLVKQGATREEIENDFRTPTRMRIFTYDGMVDTLMSPRDSILHHKKIMRGSFMAMDPNTGYVKAYVGGPDFRFFKYDMVRQGKRHIGSTIKPFVYCFAIDYMGMTPCTMVPNLPVTLETDNMEPWQPKEAGRVVYDGVYHPLRWGLAHSRNNYSAWIMKQAKDPKAVADFIHQMGIHSYIDPVNALALGPVDVSLFEMVGAYGTFVNKGVFTEPIFITRIEDRQGNVIASFVPAVSDAISEQTAYTMVQMLQNNVRTGTGGRLRWMYGFSDVEMGGKTGTSQEGRDAWFMGVTPNLVAGTWVGCEDQSAYLLSGAEGASIALPVFAGFMKQVYEDPSCGVRRTDRFYRPAGAIEYDCPDSEAPDRMQDDEFFE